MASEIIKVYISTLSQFFSLSDRSLSEAAIQRKGEDPPLPSFVPGGTSVLTACRYAEKIVEEISEAANDILSIDVSPEAVHGVKKMVDSFRWRFEEAIAATWARDSRSLHTLEDWTKGTKYLPLVDTFQTRIVASAQRVGAGCSEPDAVKRRIKDNFVDTMCFLFDGIMNSNNTHTDPGPRRMSRMSSSRVPTINDFVGVMELFEYYADTRIRACS